MERDFGVVVRNDETGDYLAAARHFSGAIAGYGCAIGCLRLCDGVRLRQPVKQFGRYGKPVR